jgi:N-acetylglucosaminyldiphosphoundecaprenol N-acetyl-beta-D-mannosaminyltransferase
MMIKILGIKCFDRGIENALELILDQSKGDKLNYCVSATGAHGIITAYKTPEFKALLNSFYLNLPDGMPLVWVGRLKGAKAMQRCYGPDFFKGMISKTADKPIKHFICGGKDGVAEELKKVCEEKFGNGNIVGTYTPPFREMTPAEFKDLALKINSLNADFVWVGLSTPKQEVFTYHLSEFTNVRFLFTVGAAFDFHIGKVKQAPKWIQKVGMEWFFRLTVEPKRLWKRYSKIVPLFIWYNLLEIFKGNFIENMGGRQ